MGTRFQPGTALITTTQWMLDSQSPPTISIIACTGQCLWQEAAWEDFHPPHPHSSSPQATSKEIYKLSTKSILPVEGSFKPSPPAPRQAPCSEILELPLLWASCRNSSSMASDLLPKKDWGQGLIYVLIVSLSSLTITSSEWASPPRSSSTLKTLHLGQIISSP